MKQLSKILPLVLVSVLVLTACANPFARQQEGTAVVETQVTVGKTPAKTDGQKQDVSDLRYGSNVKCGQLKSSEMEQQCERQLNELIGGMLENEIISTYDLNRCKELPEDIAANCQKRIGDTGVQGPVSAEEIALFEEIMRGTLSGDADEPLLTYDSSHCTELKTPGYRAYCEKQMAEKVQQNLFDQIIQSEKSSRCNELSDELMKRDCQAYFGVSVAEDFEPDTVTEVVTEVVDESDQ